MNRRHRSLCSLAALCMSPWHWLSPKAKLYKGLLCAIAVLLLLALVDQALVLPALEGWLAALGLVGALGLTLYLAWHWYEDVGDDEETAPILLRPWSLPDRS